MMDLEEQLGRAMERGCRTDAYLAMYRYRVELVAQGRKPEIVREMLTDITNRALRGLDEKEEHSNG